jgi:hypothetical protein
VLPSGARKSAVFRDVIGPIEQVEQNAVEEARNLVMIAEEEAEHLKRERSQLRKDVAAGDRDVEDLHDVAARISSHHIPEFPRLVADDVTSEQLQVLLERHGGGWRGSPQRVRSSTSWPADTRSRV